MVIFRYSIENMTKSLENGEEINFRFTSRYLPLNFCHSNVFLSSKVCLILGTCVRSFDISCLQFMYITSTLFYFRSPGVYQKWCYLVVKKFHS